MLKPIKKILHFFFKKQIKKTKLYLNKNGKKRKCYVCGNTFNYFSKYCGGSENIPEFIRKLDCVGSDVDNFKCPYCLANDRERHLYMFFDKLELWDHIPSFSILHFAPEKNLSKKIKELNPVIYISADYYPKNDDIKKIDATNILYDNDSFDLVICNHVLEHIPNYLLAIEEIHRVLKPNGIGILQTPYSKILQRNFEDKNINTDDLRSFFYGEKDHFRIFSEQHFFDDLKKQGFDLNIIKHSELFDDESSYYFGVNTKEDLVKVIKTNP